MGASSFSFASNARPSDLRASLEQLLKNTLLLSAGSAENEAFSPMDWHLVPLVLSMMLSRAARMFWQPYGCDSRSQSRCPLQCLRWRRVYTSRVRLI
jgi:hypothetical protein